MKNLKGVFYFKVAIVLFTVILLSGFVLLMGCSAGQSIKAPESISLEKVDQILKTQQDKYTLIDVRTTEEFEGAHLYSAVLIPVDDLEERYTELVKNKPVIVYCKSGRRSAKAAAILVSKNFLRVYDMTGGIDAWLSKGYPVVIGTAVSDAKAGTVNATQETENAGTKSETSDITEINYITADDLYTKVTKGEDIIILDVRSVESYTAKHIKNAINIPYSELEVRTGELDNTKEIIVYCSNYDCGLSANAVTLLIGAGFKNVYAFEGGIENWQDKGYPVE